MKGVVLVILSLAFLGCRTVTVSRVSSVVSVDYDRSMDDWTKAGKYKRYEGNNQENVDLNNFKSEKTGKAELEMRLMCFKGVTTLSKVMKKFNRFGFGPANLQELFAYLEKYPKTSGGRVVEALGSIWVERGGERRSPAVWGSPESPDSFLKTRMLGIEWLGIGEYGDGLIDESAFFENSCFVAIPK